jgi:hypothetical protein
MFHFVFGALDGKAPVNLNGPVVALGRPGLHLRGQFLDGGDTLVQPLTGQGGEFQFGHVQPGAVFGRKMVASTAGVTLRG